MRIAFASMLVAFAIPALAAEPALNLDNVSWLAGKWQGASGDRIACEEYWSAPAGRAMVGMFRLVTGQGPAVYELLLLEEDKEGVWMRLRHFNPQMVAREQEPIKMKLVSASNEKLVFENAADNLPKRITYALSGNELTASVETERGGKPASFDLKMVRAK